MDQVLDQKITAFLNAHKEEMAQQLAELVRIPSQTEAAEPGAPFGAPLRRILDEVLALCAAQGMAVRDFDGYCGDATWGDDQNGAVATLSHLDVVPAGEGWTMPPFCGDIHDGKVWGRGSNDNKASVVSVLYAVMALQEAGFTPKRAIRMIVGCDEESGMADMEHYVSVARPPEMAFSPDAGFPVTHAEKCIMSGRVYAAFTGPTAVLSLTGGTRVNVVPNLAHAEVTLPADTLPRAQDIAVEATPQGARITATGTAAHAAWAQEGVNAIGRLMAYLHLILPEGDGARAAVDFYCQHIGMASDGAGLGIACQDEISGALTHNIGVLHGNGDAVELGFDIRHPVTLDPDACVKTLTQTWKGGGFDLADLSVSPALYVPVDHPLVATLMGVYQELTGDMTPPQVMGGGTYARTLPCAVAFGPGMPGTSANAHMADEWVTVDSLVDSARIFAHALARLSWV